jgi:hypothetical protein
VLKTRLSETLYFVTANVLCLDGALKEAVPLKQAGGSPLVFETNTSYYATLSGQNLARQCADVSFTLILLTERTANLDIQSEEELVWPAFLGTACDRRLAAGGQDVRIRVEHPTPAHDTCRGRT